MVMAAGDHAGGGRDHYQLLGVPRDASRQEIAQAWRRRARDEHPDARPCDAGAAARFRDLAEAWQVLGDADRRAAYDRLIARGPRPAASVRIVVRHSRPAQARGPAAPGSGSTPPLRAGPVWVGGVPALGRLPAGDRDIALAYLAALAERYLARDRRRPW
jgi:curved DNA-binding protein CbpA